MRTTNLISVLVLFSLLAACNMPVGQPPASQPSGSTPVSSDVNVIGTAAELTSVARLTEIAGSVTPTFTSTPALTPIPTQCSPLVTSTTNANVRSGPGTAYDIVGALTLGQTAVIAGRNDAATWWYINYPSVGSYAWIAGSVVTASCVPAVVQVMAAPPLPTAQPVVADSASENEGDSNTPEIVVMEMVALGPDLVPAGMQISPNPATQGQEIHVHVGVKNMGNVASASFTMQWWSTHSSISCSWTVPSLAPGETVNRSCSYTYSGWATYDVKLVIDPGNTVTETNEGNNSMVRKLKVQDAP